MKIQKFILGLMLFGTFVFIQNVSADTDKPIPMQYMLGGAITIFIVMIITYGLMQLASYANDSKN